MLRVAIFQNKAKLTYKKEIISLGNTNQCCQKVHRLDVTVFSVFITNGLQYWGRYIDKILRFKIK